MAEVTESKRAAWVTAVCVHFALVSVSVLLTLMIVPTIVPFDPEGAAIMGAVFAVLFGHGVAVVVGLFFPKTSVTSCTTVFCIAFFFTGCMSVQAWQRWSYLHYQTPYDRFRDHLVSPVPKSVSNLRFVSMEDGISPNLMFQFDIDPADMDAILEMLKLNRVDSKNMLNPKDFFRHVYYMPVEGEYHVFQGKGRFDEVLTIKTNEAHTHAIFRVESSNFYRDRAWENPPLIQTQMDDEALQKLKKRYETAREEKARK